MIRSKETKNTLSAAHSLQDRLVSELELSRTGNKLELVVDGVGVLLLEQCG